MDKFDKFFEKIDNAFNKVGEAFDHIGEAFDHLGECKCGKPSDSKKECKCKNKSQINIDDISLEVSCGKVSLTGDIKELIVNGKKLI